MRLIAHQHSPKITTSAARRCRLRRDRQRAAQAKRMLCFDYTFGEVAFAAVRRSDLYGPAARCKRKVMIWR